MYYFPWCLLLLFGFTASEDIYSNVTIKWEENVLSLKYSPPILIENKPFKIIVETSPFNAQNNLKIKCHYHNTNKMLIDDVELTQEKGEYVAEVGDASEKMTNPWSCSIKSKLGANIYQNLGPLIFSAHVRLRDMRGEMRVNGRKINLDVTKLSVPDYDAVGTYYYRDGELANITCHKPLKYNKIYNLRTLFYNVSDTQHKTGTDKEDVNLYLKLGHRHSPKHIDCVLSKMNKPGSNKIRLMFEPISGEIDYPQFQINGLSLTPSEGTDPGFNNVFVYEYYNGEDLAVRLNLDLKRFKSMRCKAVNFTNDVMLGHDTELSFSVSTHQFTYPQASVDCFVYGKNDRQDCKISVKFIEDSMKFSPYVTGIHWSDIIAKFNDNINRTYSEGTIYASYNGDDNITLQCFNDITNVRWINNTEVNSTLLTISPTESTYNSTTNISSRTFQLSKNVNETALKCIHYVEINTILKTSKVVLIRGKKKTEQRTGKAKYPNNSENNNTLYAHGFDETTNNTNPSYDDYEDGESPGNRFLHILIGVISLFIVIFITTLIVCIRKQRKLPKTDSDINYENLPAHNEGSMPIPSQWDTNRFKNENMEEPYAKVIPKSQRTKVTEIYSEPLSNTEDVCYATPYNANSESPYAEIIPQCQRNENVPSASVNVECYAQVVPKSIRNVAKNQVLPANDTVKNGAKLRPRADTDKHKYANVFNSEMYANVNSSGC